MRKRTICIYIVAILCFLVLMIITPAIPQSQDYHDFADHRQFWGVPNMLNAMSNAPCTVILYILFRFRPDFLEMRLQDEFWGWFCFFMGVGATGAGSYYYHVEPNDARLVWDRLPMTVAFTSIVAIFITERIDEQKGKMSIIPILLADIISILYARIFDDLRPYALVQIIPWIAIPLMAILLPPMYTHSSYWLWAAGFYLLAKVEEAADKPIYRWTHHIVSGHTLNHLCAAMVPVVLLRMLAERSIEYESRSLLLRWVIWLTKVKENGSDEESSCPYTQIQNTSSDIVH